MAKEILESGAAHKKFLEIIEAQGKKINQSQQVKIGQYTHECKSIKAGKVKSIDNINIAKLARYAGCPKDKKAGIFLKIHKGDNIKKGDTMFTIYAESKKMLDFAIEYLKKTKIVEVG